MKKLTFILIILILTLILITSSGCFIQEKIALNKAIEDEKIEFNKSKQEIIKFDEEFWKIGEEWRLLSEEITKSYDEINSNKKKHADNKKLAYQDILEEKIIVEKSNKDYSDYVLKFKNLNIPKTLDDFYYKKIEQFNATQFGSGKYLQWLNFLISMWDSSFDETTSEKLGTMLKESEDYSQKSIELQLEAKKIQREVYRTYGLDDLITKWQK